MLLSLYSIETRQPVAFTKQPVNQPDVITIENALKQLQALGINSAEIVTDNGYYSEKNLAELLHAHFDFITLIKNSIKWVKKELDSHLDEFRTTSSACPFDINTHGITVMRMQEFSRARKYASTKKGLAEGDEEIFRRRIYLHLFFNPLRRVEQDTVFDKDIFELKALIEDGASEEDLSDSAAEKARKFLHIRHYGQSARSHLTRRQSRHRRSIMVTLRLYQTVRRIRLNVFASIAGGRQLNSSSNPANSVQTETGPGSGQANA